MDSVRCHRKNLYHMVQGKFCQDNTAVTTPNTVTVATHSATKEAVVEMRTPEEGDTMMTSTN